MFSGVYVEPDGSRVMELSASPVRVHDVMGAGGWLPVDTTLVMDSGGVHPVQAASAITLSDGGADGFLARISGGVDAVSLGWLRSLPTPILSGDEARYVDALPGIDVVVRVGPAGFEQFFVVKRRPTMPLVVNQPLGLRGLTAVVNALGQLELRDARSGVVVSDPGYATIEGAATDPHSGLAVDSATVPIVLGGTPDAPTLVLAPDAAFFDRPRLTYPVTIDPWFPLSDTWDVYTSKTYSTAVYENKAEFRTGTYDGVDVDRSFLRFNVSQLGSPSVALLSGTHLDLFETWAWSCTPRIVEAWAAAAAPVFDATHSISWAGSSTTSPMPGLLTRYAYLNTAKGYSSSCPAGTISLSTGSAGQDLSGLVWNWTHGMTNNGIVLKAYGDELDTFGWKRFASGATATPPVLQVPYDTLPNVPTGFAVNGSSAATQTASSGALALSATFSDPDATAGWVKFPMTPAATGVRADYFGTQTPSGSASTTTVTVADGRYDVQAYGYDGYHRYDGWPVDSAPTNAISVTVDSVAPSAPVITPTVTYGMISASWTATDNAATNGAVGGVSGYRVLIDGSPTTFANTGTLQTTATATNVPDTPGPWYVHVASVDVAGNISTTSTTAALTVVVDAYAPDVPIITAPVKAAVLSSARVHLSAAFRDGDAGEVGMVQFNIRSGTGALVATAQGSVVTCPESCATDGQAPQGTSDAWVDVPAAGSYSVEAISSDTVRHSTSTALTFTVARVAPAYALPDIGGIVTRLGLPLAGAVISIRYEPYASDSAGTSFFAYAGSGVTDGLGRYSIPIRLDDASVIDMVGGSGLGGTVQGNLMVTADDGTNNVDVEVVATAVQSGQVAGMAPAPDVELSPALNGDAAPNQAPPGPAPGVHFPVPPSCRPKATKKQERQTWMPITELRYSSDSDFNTEFGFSTGTEHVVTTSFSIDAAGVIKAKGSHAVSDYAEFEAHVPGVAGDHKWYARYVEARYVGVNAACRYSRYWQTLKWIGGAITSDSGQMDGLHYGGLRCTASTYASQVASAGWTYGATNTTKTTESFSLDLSLTSTPLFKTATIGIGAGIQADNGASKTWRVGWKNVSGHDMRYCLVLNDPNAIEAMDAIYAP